MIVIWMPSKIEIETEVSINSMQFIDLMTSKSSARSLIWPNYPTFSVRQWWFYSKIWFIEDTIRCWIPFWLSFNSLAKITSWKCDIICYNFFWLTNCCWKQLNKKKKKSLVYFNYSKGSFSISLPDRPQAMNFRFFLSRKPNESPNPNWFWKAENVHWSIEVNTIVESKFWMCENKFFTQIFSMSKNLFLR
jgi:hypothetical protein